jgi:hypothetical protein
MRHQPGKLFGGFAQWRGVGAGSSAPITGLFLGGEWQSMYGPFLLYLQGAYENLSVPASPAVTGWLVSGTGSFFVHPNWRIDLNVGYDALDGGLGTGDIETVALGIGTEIRFSNPLSLFARYTRYIVDASGTSANANLFLVGARLNVGSPTLLARAQAGASLQPVQCAVFAFLC